MLPLPADAAPPMPPNTTSREYPRTRKSRIRSYLILPAVALAAVGVPLYFLWHGSPGGWAIGGFILWVLVVGVVLRVSLFDALKGRFIVDAQGLQCIDVTGTRTLAVDEIRGYRIDAQTSFCRIYAKDTSEPPLYFDSGTECYTELQHWLRANFSDLNQQDAQQARVQQTQALAAVLETPSLGHTPAERTQSLSKAKKLATWLNGAGWLTGACLWFPPEPDEWAIMAGLLLPLVVAVVLALWPDRLRLDGDKSNGYPALFAAFLVPSAGLLLSTNSYFEWVSHAPLWPVAGAAAAGTAAALAYGSRRFLWRPKPALDLAAAIVVLALLYGYSASSFVNVQYDQAAPKTYTPLVLSKSMSKGKYQNFYYLKISAWGPFASAQDVPVSYHCYVNAEPSQPVTVTWRPGLLGVPWFRVSI